MKISPSSPAVASNRPHVLNLLTQMGTSVGVGLNSVTQTHLLKATAFDLSWFHFEDSFAFNGGRFFHSENFKSSSFTDCPPVDERIDKVFLRDFSPDDIDRTSVEAFDDFDVFEW